MPPMSFGIHARLDTMTRAKLEDLATHFRQSHEAVLQQVTRWGLGRELPGQLGGDDTRGPVQSFLFVVDTDVHRQVRRAAEAAGTEVAAWLRPMLRAVTVADVPASWQAGKGPNGKRIVLQLDESTWKTLEGLSQHFGKSNAEIIRQLLAKPTPKLFPRSWHRAAAERSRA